MSALPTVPAAAPAWPGLQLLADMLTTAETPMLTPLIDLLTARLHQQAATLSNEQVSAIMRLIGRLDEQREEAELVANPDRRAGLDRLSKHQAH
ncbi:hypothetical protein A0257_12265 [Hymenobacter psoromatis]|nr:hypothetical protein A0257_12265 [Hymenobacter psoromatis]